MLDVPLKVDGGKLKELRLRAGLSQEQLARRCRVSNLTIFRIETGKTQATRELTLMSIADALSVEPDELLFGEQLIRTRCLAPRKTEAAMLDERTSPYDELKELFDWLNEGKRRCLAMRRLAHNSSAVRTNWQPRGAKPP
jgi:transcriptional regulator with XRE-family HTH domain